MAAEEDRTGEQSVVAARMTVGLIPKAVGDLTELLTLTGLSKTDIINRAVSLHAFVGACLARGDELLVRRRDTGHVERVHLL